MEVDEAANRHTILKRKAEESINEILNFEQSSESPQKKARKSNLSKFRDIDSYKEIIKSFKAPIWYGCAITPRDLADYGWACVKKDVVKCVECEQYLSTGLPNIDKVSFNVYNSTLQEIHEKMISAHRSTCKMRCGAPPIRIIEPSSKDILDGIEGRLADVKNMTEDDLKADIPHYLNLPKIEGIPAAFVYVSAVGWKISRNKRGSLIIGCDYCARELAIRTGNKFDPIHNHERWCPRIDMDELGEPSWMADLNIVLNTKNRLPNRYLDSAIFKEAYAARRLLDNSLSSSSSIIAPTYI